MGISWTCPFCNRPTTITKEDVESDTIYLNKENVEGNQAVTCRFIVCPNSECKKFTLLVTLSEAKFYEGRGWTTPAILKTWQLIPQSKAQSFPDYIPKAILDDYNEACLIRDLSPKASATLSRRCLQGMIRDFWGVKGKNLKNEIDEIKDKVDQLSWEAIEAVRKIGNIGAHMEKDINLIVDVELNEAELLIQLIEGLLKDWYIARNEREGRLKSIAKIAEDKETARKAKEDMPSN
ncbi:MAG: hypothetical protein A2Z75_00695 [Chloroflexi bacterium RBG_13_50_10]|nr:MAG: hypothetical protein A2Z75_00695 [Chloroflexi bacterium RBG_13_50_10]